VFDELLEAEVLRIRRSEQVIAYWDVDAAATLDRLDRDPLDAFAALIPAFDFVFTYGGGEPVVNAYLRRGAVVCVPIYNAVDPEAHFPVSPQPRYQADLSFLGNRLPDREARVEEFFLKAAALMPDRRCLLGGSGWADKNIPANVRYVGHVQTADHNAWNCSAKAVLNISRDSMARYGYSPATRVFEAAGAGACLITDAWEGIERFFEPGVEVLVAASGAEVAEIASKLSDKTAREIGLAARRRALAEHTYAQRAAGWERALQHLVGLSGAAR
jgi:spore maturation protein CgeB